MRPPRSPAIENCDTVPLHPSTEKKQVKRKLAGAKSRCRNEVLDKDEDERLHQNSAKQDKNYKAAGLAIVPSCQTSHSIFSKIPKMCGEKGFQAYEDGRKALAQSFLNDLCFWDNEISHCPERQALSRKALSVNSLPDHRSNAIENSQQESMRSRSYENLCSESELRWQVAYDRHTGRIYYYNSVTMQSQWKKVSPHFSSFPFPLETTRF